MIYDLKLLTGLVLHLEKSTSMTSKLLAIVIAFLPSVLFAQSFEIESETDTIKKSITLDSYNDINVDIRNLTNGDVTLAWEVINRSEVTGWDFSLCDLGNCHIGVPESGEMWAMDTETKAFLKISANPQGMVGNCMFTFKVFDKDNPSDADTITMIADAAVGIPSITAFNQQVFPNPATNVLNVRSDEAIVGLQLFNTVGQVVLTQNLNMAELNTSLDVSGIELGQYILVIRTDKGLTRASIVKN